MGRWPLVLPLAALALLGPGCIARQRPAPGEFDGAWSLTETGWDEARPKRLALGRRALAARWTLRQEPRAEASAAVLAAAIARVNQGAEEIALAVSPDQARLAAAALRDFGAAIEDLAAISQADARPTRRRWASAVAGGVVIAEGVARRAGGGGAAGAADAWAAPPIVEMALGYLDRQTGGGLLADLEALEGDGLRGLVAQTVLRLGFALAGKREPEGLRQDVVDLMRTSGSPQALRASAEKVLEAGLDAAPSATPQGGLAELADPVFTWGPRALEFLAMVLEQWDRLQRLDLEFRERDGRILAAVTAQVAPGRAVRIAGLFPMQPVLEARGRVRAVLVPESAATGETVLALGPVEEGAVEVRFEGLGYALVRGLALPLADARLREVRVGAERSAPDVAVRRVVLVMEAAGGGKDPRRVLAYEGTRWTRLVRRLPGVRLQTERREQTFTYAVPERLYIYRRAEERRGG